VGLVSSQRRSSPAVIPVRVLLWFDHDEENAVVEGFIVVVAYE
jgi:hypothetical protein